VWSDDTSPSRSSRPAALIVLGIGLVIGTWWGRGRSLIASALVVSVVLACAATLDVPLRGGLGERTWEPTSASDLRSPYRLAIGNAELDLSGIDPNGGTVEVTASVAMGRLLVIVPSDVDLVLDGHTGFGHVEGAGSAMRAASASTSPRATSRSPRHAAHCTS
jgi:hypothetical protein